MIIKDIYYVKQFDWKFSLSINYSYQPENN